MSVRNLAAAGLVTFALGGPLLGVGLLTDGGVSLALGAAGLWLGLLLVLAAMLQLGRTHHQMLRSQKEAMRILGERLERRDATGDEAATEVAPALLERFADIERAVDQGLETQRRELLQVVDARIIGIHETVRDLTDGRRP